MVTGFVGGLGGGAMIGGPVGALIGGGIGAAWGGAVGEDLAEQYEVAQGQREAVDKGEVAIAGALSAVPNLTLGRLAARPGLKLATRAILHGGEGATQGYLDAAAMAAYQHGRLPTSEETIPSLLGGAVLGTGLGTGFGMLEGGPAPQPRAGEIPPLDDSGLLTSLDPAAAPVDPNAPIPLRDPIADPIVLDPAEEDVFARAIAEQTGVGAGAPGMPPTRAGAGAEPPATAHSLESAVVQAGRQLYNRVRGWSEWAREMVRAFPNANGRELADLHARITVEDDLQATGGSGRLDETAPEVDEDVDLSGLETEQAPAPPVPPPTLDRLTQPLRQGSPISMRTLFDDGFVDFPGFLNQVRMQDPYTPESEIRGAYNQLVDDARGQAGLPPLGQQGGQVPYDPNNPPIPTATGDPNAPIAATPPSWSGTTLRAGTTTPAFPEPPRASEDPRLQAARDIYQTLSAQSVGRPNRLEFARRARAADPSVTNTEISDVFDLLDSEANPTPAPTAPPPSSSSSTTRAVTPEEMQSLYQQAAGDYSRFYDLVNQIDGRRDDDIYSDWSDLRQQERRQQALSRTPQEIYAQTGDRYYYRTERQAQDPSLTPDQLDAEFQQFEREAAQARYGSLPLDANNEPDFGPIYQETIANGGGRLEFRQRVQAAAPNSGFYSYDLDDRFNALDYERQSAETEAAVLARRPPGAPPPQRSLRPFYAGGPTYDSIYEGIRSLRAASGSSPIVPFPEYLRKVHESSYNMSTDDVLTAWREISEELGVDTSNLPLFDNYTRIYSMPDIERYIPEAPVIFDNTPSVSINDRYAASREFNAALRARYPQLSESQADAALSELISATQANQRSVTPGSPIEARVQAERARLSEEQRKTAEEQDKLRSFLGTPGIDPNIKRVATRRYQAPELFKGPKKESMPLTLEDPGRPLKRAEVEGLIEAGFRSNRGGGSNYTPEHLARAGLPPGAQPENSFAIGLIETAHSVFTKRPGEYTIKKIPGTNAEMAFSVHDSQTEPHNIHFRATDPTGQYTLAAAELHGTPKYVGGNPSGVSYKVDMLGGWKVGAKEVTDMFNGMIGAGIDLTSSGSISPDTRRILAAAISRAEVPWADVVEWSAGGTGNSSFTELLSKGKGIENVGTKEAIRARVRERAQARREAARARGAVSGADAQSDPSAAAGGIGQADGGEAQGVVRTDPGAGGPDAAQGDPNVGLATEEDGGSGALGARVGDTDKATEPRPAGRVPEPGEPGGRGGTPPATAHSLESAAGEAAVRLARGVGDLAKRVKMNLSPRPKPLPGDRAVVEKKFIDWVEEDLPRAIEAYWAKARELGTPNEIGGDIAKELSPDYAESKESRLRYTQSIAKATSWLATQVYNDAMSRPIKPGHWPVVLATAGGTGSGKSSAREIEALKPYFANADLIFDSTLSDYDSAVAKIEAAKASGRKFVATYIYREPLDAYVNGVLPRAEKTGRTVSLAEGHAKTHTNSPRVFNRLMAEYANDPMVELSVIDNSRGLGNQAPIDRVPEKALQYDENEIVRSARESPLFKLRESYVDYVDTDEYLQGLEGGGTEEILRAGEELSEPAQPQGVLEADDRGDGGRAEADQVGRKPAKSATAHSLESAAAEGAKQLAEKAPIFFSAVARAVKSKLSPKGGIPPMQALRTLQNTPGVKGDEIKWLGLDDWLKDLHSKGVRVTRAELEEFLRVNEIKVEEIEKGGRVGPEVPAREAISRTPVYGDREDLVLPGGNDYRELLLKLPDKKEDPVMGAFRSWLEAKKVSKQHIAQLVETVNDRDPYWMQFKHETGNTGTVGKSGNFRGPHWGGNKNVLSHVRFTTRYDADGKKVLFLEEVQSDWGQGARKYGVVGGYQPKKPNKFFDPVPPGPFVTKDGKPNTEGWVGLTMKRMLRYAAENGFDRVAWTTGEMQNQRYNLAKHVDELNLAVYGGVVGDPDVSYNLTAYKNGTDVVAERDISAERVKELIGEELGTKALEQVTDYESATLRGQDLEIGGEGMKAFYDQILPQWLDKYTRKWGAKVEPTKVSLGAFGSPDMQSRPELKFEAVQSVPITPQMKQSVLYEGQSMHDLGSAVGEAAGKVGKAVSGAAKRIFGAGSGGGRTPPPRAAAPSSSPRIGGAPVDFDPISGEYAKGKAPKAGSGAYSPRGPRSIPTPPDSGRAALDTSPPAPSGRPSGRPGPEADINVPRISTDPKVESFVSRAVRAGSDFYGRGPKGARGPKRSWEEVRKKAVALGLDASAVRRAWKNKGGMLSDVEIEAASIVIHETHDRARKHHEKAEKLRAEGRDRDADLQEDLFDSELTNLQSVTYAMIGAKSEAARALAISRKIGQGLTPEERNAWKLLQKTSKYLLNRSEIPQSPEFRQKMYDALLEKNSKKVTELLSSAYDKGFLDKYVEWWTAGLLSGPPTQVVNFASNAIEALVSRPAERAIEGLLAQGAGKGPKDRYFGEALAMYRGAVAAQPRALFGPDGLAVAIKDIFALGYEDKQIAKAIAGDETALGFLEFGRAIEGKKGEAIRIPLNILQAADQYWKSVTQSQELYAEAYRDGRRAGLKGQQLNKHIHSFLRDFSKDRQPEVWARVLRAMDDATYQTQLGGIGRSIQQVATRHPILRLLGATFIRTPTNLLKKSVGRTPLGLLRLSNKNLTPEQRRSIKAQALFGSAVIAAMFTAMESEEGLEITGGGPEDWNRREELRQTGWEPYSIRYNGGPWISYKRLDPLSSVVGMVADMKELSSLDKLSEKLDKATAALGENAFDKSFWSGLLQTFEAVTQMNRGGPARWVKQQMGSHIPMTGFVTKIAQAIDPLQRDSQAFETVDVGGVPIPEPVAARLPGASTLLPAKRTIAGEPKVRNQNSPLEQMFNPFTVSKELQGAIPDLQRELVAVEASVDQPQKFISFRDSKGRKVQLDLDDREYGIVQDQYKEAAKHAIRLTKSSYYKNLPDDEDKKAALEKVFREARAKGRAKLYTDPGFRAREKEARRKSNAPKRPEA